LQKLVDEECTGQSTPLNGRYTALLEVTVEIKAQHNERAEWIRREKENQ
jgi:hypothetical protein